jgi:glycosyltransferase involved in cell wall biosynthesis
MLALITPYYLPHIGGVEVHVANLARRLAKKYRTIIISSKPSKADYQIKSLQVPYSPIPMYFPKVKAEIYHSHVPSPFFALKADEVAKEIKAYHIITYHNDVVVPERVDGLSIPNFFGKIIEKYNEKIVLPLLERSDTVIATTRSYAETSSVLSSVQDKLEIVPNGVDTSVFTPSKNSKRNEVLYVGRLVEYKGLPHLIKAMKSVQAMEDVKLRIVGEGEDRRMFEEMCRRLEVRAEFTGRLSREGVIKAMREAKVLVLPSFSRLEAFGIVLLEAMACGTPVIGANVPGVGEVAAKAGFVFESEEELAELILSIIRDETLVKKLGRRGRKVVEKEYSWDVVIKMVEKVYSKVVG